MVLYYERGLSQSTLCRLTGLSPSALRVRLFRARGVLAEEARQAS
jgi:DNA-directed RNA polymerase specialized sigma24 family protein